MTSLHANLPDGEHQFAFGVVEESDTYIYEVTVVNEGWSFMVETVRDPEARYLVDATLTAYKEESLLRAQEHAGAIRNDIDRGIY